MKLGEQIKATPPPREATVVKFRRVCTLELLKDKRYEKLE